jgi:hypothetical protein
MVRGGSSPLGRIRKAPLAGLFSYLGAAFPSVRQCKGLPVPARGRSIAVLSDSPPRSKVSLVSDQRNRCRRPSRGGAVSRSRTRHFRVWRNGAVSAGQILAHEMAAVSWKQPPSQWPSDCRMTWKRAVRSSGQWSWLAAGKGRRRRRLLRRPIIAAVLTFLPLSAARADGSARRSPSGSGRARGPAARARRESPGGRSRSSPGPDRGWTCP